MFLPTFVVNNVMHSIIHREPWNGASFLGGAMPMGSAWLYHVQAVTGETYGIIVNYPFTYGSNINTDYAARDAKMIELAFETDFEGIKQQGTKGYSISVKQPPYDAILSAMP